MNARTIEIRCAEPGCSRTTTACATSADKGGNYSFDVPTEPGWQIPARRRGTNTGGDSSWAYGTCPDHSTAHD